MSKRSAVFGTKKNDVLTGTEGLNIMFGKKGNDTLHGLGGKDFMFGGKGNDKLFGDDGNDFLFGGKGHDELHGGKGNDKLFGGKGNDKLFGGEGNDKLFGGKSNDFLDGGAGSDYLFGGKGDDTFNFNMSENIGAKDYYDGGKGFDTLQLTLTSAELKLESVQKDIAAFEAFLKHHANANGYSGELFQFESFGLSVRDFEALKIVEIGGNTTPVAVNDTFPGKEDDAIGGDLLFNDTDAEDGKPSIVSAVNGAAGNVGATITLASGALLTVNADGTFAYDPNGQFEALGANDTAEDSFTYQALDSGGAVSNVATAKIVVQGANDRPEALNDSNTTGEDTSVTGNVLDNDCDVDRGEKAALRVSEVNGEAVTGSVRITLPSGALLTMNEDGGYIYDPNGQFESLGAGQSAQDSFTYVAIDPHSASSNIATVNVTITGVDDAPSLIKVAVVGADSNINSAVVTQLMDNKQLFNFDATPINITTITSWSSAFNGYDVVVVGEEGISTTVEHDNAGLLGALNAFIAGGGGVVTAGLFAGYFYEAAGAETVSPAKIPLPADAGVKLSSGSLITVTPLDAAGDFIAGNIADVGIPGSYAAADGLHEVAAAGIDATAQVLAVDSLGRVAIAYDASAPGRTVYLGSLHMHSAGSAARAPESTVDELFERAVAWASGVGPSGATIPSSLESTSLASSWDGAGDALAFSTTALDDALL